MNLTGQGGVCLSGTEYAPHNLVADRGPRRIGLCPTVHFAMPEPGYRTNNLPGTLMLDKSPAVSVGIPVYNGERYLAQAIESVLGQSYTDLELLIVDNASTDETPTIAARLGATDQRIRYLANQTNIGAAANFNRAFVESRGRYFVWLACDDYWEPDFLARCIKPLEEDESCILAFPKVRVVDESDQHLEFVDGLNAVDALVPEDRYREILGREHNSYYIFGAIRSDVLRRTKLIIPCAHGDTILLTRLSLLGRFAKVDQYLFVSRRHATQSNKQFLDQTQPMSLDFAGYSRWFARPDASTEASYPYSRTLFEYYRALSGIRMSLRSWISCRLLLLTQFRGYRRGLMAEARRFVLRPLRALRECNVSRLK